LNAWADANTPLLSAGPTPLDLALAERDAGALFVVNHSGGKDSQALLIKVREVVPAHQVIVIHATLGESEWPGALEHAQQHAEAAGVPFLVAKADKSFLEMVAKRFADRPEVVSWPGSLSRTCQSDLKRSPIEKAIRRYTKTHGFTRVVNCMGLRAAESSKRSKIQPWRRNDKQSIAAREWFDWLPIHAFTTAEVLGTVREAGQQLHHAYALGNERLSCVFCIFSSAKDARNGALHNPELYARYVEMERRTGYTMHVNRKSLPELTGISV